MCNISKQILRNYDQEQNFISSTGVLNVMKEMVKEVLQGTLETEKSHSSDIINTIYLKTVGMAI